MYALLTLISLAFTYFAIIFFLRVRLKLINNAISKNYLFLSDFISLSFFNVRDIKLKQKELFYKNKYLEIFREISTNIKQSSLISNLPKFFIDFFAVLIVSSVTLLCIQSKEVNILETIAIIVFVGSRFLPQIQQSYKAYVLLRSSIYAYDSLNDYSKFDKKYISADKNTKRLTKDIHFKKRILLKDISFSYHKKKIINRLDINITKGGHYKIAGPSGSGKSTLINIIMGLLKPSSGLVFIDNERLNEKNLSAFQNLIAQVSQSSYFIKGTVSQNVSLDANILFDDKKIIKVLKIVGFYNDKLSISQNLNFQIEEFGMNISGGQRQRLAIARALYNRFEILFLDEATNALDKESESFIFKNIAKYYPDITLIYISHNPIPFNRKDKIVNIS
jgi:ABC-type bacteriocin/lantibiotic exporter with double-glycine peptidase domain